MNSNEDIPADQRHVRQFELLAEEYNTQLVAHANYMFGIFIAFGSILIGIVINVHGLLFYILLIGLGVLFLATALYFFTRLLYYLKLLNVVHVFLGLASAKWKKSLDESYNQFQERMRKRNREAEIGLAGVVHLEFVFQIFHLDLFYRNRNAIRFTSRVFDGLLRVRRREPDRREEGELSETDLDYRDWKEIRTEVLRKTPMIE